MERRRKNWPFRLYVQEEGVQTIDPVIRRERLDTALKLYREAYVAAPRQYADLNSTRRHAGWWLDHWIQAGGIRDADTAIIDAWLPLPTVIVFAGQLLDRAGRTPERFPANLTDAVKQTIKDWLISHNALIGFSSAACGADLLFQKALQELRGESCIVLPFDADEFKTTSVSFAGDDWNQRLAPARSMPAKLSQRYVCSTRPQSSRASM